MRRPGQLGEEVPNLMRSTPRRPPLRRSVPIVVLLLSAWALLTGGGARPTVRTAGAASPMTAALHPVRGPELPVRDAPPPLALTPPTPAAAPPTVALHTPHPRPGAPVAETGAPVREAEDHSSALVPIALGLALTGAAVYKHRGLPGGH